MIVLDVNAAVAMALGTEEGLALRELMLEGEGAVAPRLFLTEAANVAWQYARAGHLDESGALALFEKLAELPDGFTDDEALLVEAIHEAARCEHPVYDMLYLVLARRNAATLFTFDKRLQRLCESNGVNCLGVARL